MKMVIDIKNKEVLSEKKHSGVVAFIGWQRLIACLKNGGVLSGRENVTDVHINKDGLTLSIEKE